MQINVLKIPPLSPQCDIETYKVFIHPIGLIIEYATQVWDPYLIKNIEVLKRVHEFYGRGVYIGAGGGVGDCCPPSPTFLGRGA